MAGPNIGRLAPKIWYVTRDDSGGEMRSDSRSRHIARQEFRQIVVIAILGGMLLGSAGEAQAKGWRRRLGIQNRVKLPEVKLPDPPKVELRLPAKVLPPKGSVKKIEKIADPRQVVADAKKVVTKLPEKAKDAAEVISVHGVKETAKSLAKSGKAAVNNTANAVKDNVHNLSTDSVAHAAANPGATIRDGAERTGEAAKDETGRVTRDIRNSWWYGKVTDELLRQLLLKPHIITVDGHRPGRPVVYVNGILTTEYDARETAKLLAEKLNRPIVVIYNPSGLGTEFGQGTGLRTEELHDDDVSEAVYDRAWPACVASQIANLNGNIVGTLIGTHRLQANPTTRMLSHYLYYADDRVDVISHSQGTLVTRNALYTQTLLSHAHKARNVNWIAAGIVLNDNEIITRPGRMTILDYKNDPASTILGMRGGGIGTPAGCDHRIDRYADQLRPDMLWAD